jgi:hypothetical protein
MGMKNPIQKPRRAARHTFPAWCPRCGEDRPAYMMPERDGYWCKSCFWGGRPCYSVKRHLPCGVMIRGVSRAWWNEGVRRIG